MKRALAGVLLIKRALCSFGEEMLIRENSAMTDFFLLKQTK